MHNALEIAASSDVWIHDVQDATDKVILSKDTLTKMGFYLANINQPIPPFDPAMWAGQPPEKVFEMYSSDTA